MDQVKEAFSKVKSDIDFLFTEISQLKRTLEELKLEITANKLEKQTVNRQSTMDPAHNLPLNGLKSQNMSISTGNDGVPADSQQTDRQTVNNPLVSHGNVKSDKNPLETHLNKASEIIESLDNLKKEVRTKFKRLTTQEMSIFSALYQLEEQGFLVDYTLLSGKLGLTESSIRDYIQRLIKKGVPIEKRRENNKRIILSVSKELKKVATLETIFHLRNL